MKKPLKKDVYSLGRHKVIECDKTGNVQEVRLVVSPIDKTQKCKKICILRDFWLNTFVKVGDVVHIHADWYESFDENFESYELAIIDCRSGLIVVKPDLLVSGTSVVSSLFCQRKAVLSERFRGIEPTNQVMLNGTLVHRLLQKALIGKFYDTPSLNKIADALLCDPSTIHDLYGANILKCELKESISGYIPMVKTFIDKYVVAKNPYLPHETDKKKIASKNGKYGNPPTFWDGHIDTVCDVEENMWSPWLGIKGKVDFTVKVNDKRLGKVKMPLELKTGRSSFSAEHKGQVTLYSMMMNQQNGERKVTDGSPGGLLLYLKDGAIQHVPAGHNEKQGLVQLRNEMVKYLTSPTTTSERGEISEGPLPTRIDRVNQCNSCPLRVECTIYQIAEDSANETTPSMPLPLESVEHLTSAHQNYFLHWSKMLRLEFEESQARSRSISDIWCIDPLDREAQGYCISFLQVENCLASQNPTSELNQYSIKLVPANRIHLPTRISLQRGDSVVLSTDKEVAVATGCLVDISTSSVTVSTDRNVHNWDRNFEVLHLDKMEYQGGQTLLYANLSRLMANNANAAKLRELVIDLKLPVFKAGLPKSLLEVLWPVLRPLNAFQRRAVLKALTCEDYCLINGLPGTGKTSLIVALIRLAVRLGQSVLLTSYTHSAVDNVLLKLCQFNDVEFLRIGREHRTHSSILPYSAETKTKNCHTVEELETVYSVPVIAATCLSVGHPALIRRKFDLCIVDEAAQALQLAVLGPLTAAKKFVLVGDPLQLPPVVQSRTAKSLGMDESLFVRLSRVTPKASETLKLQYRMCGPVNALANKLTYGGELECGSEVIEQATLQLPSLTSIEQEYADRPWLLSVIKPGLRHAVVFLDTSLLGAIKANHSEIDSDESNKSPINHLEAKLALLIVKALRGSGLPYDQMGIIAPYQSQVQHLKQAAVEMPEVEINTVDQYQGRDKEAIIYSCTKSERDGESTVAEGTQTILHDIRRLTVALTRAKHKLIVIGDSQTLQSFPPFAKLLASLEASQRYQLCPGRDQI